MAAANTDKLRKKKSNFSTTLNGGISDSATTIALNSASGLPTDTAITLTIDRVDANGVSTPSFKERVTGVVSVNNLTNCLRGEDGSSAQVHNSGAIVEDIWEAETWNDHIDNHLVQHAQDGTHTAVTATSVTASAAVTGANLDLAASGALRDANDNELLKFTQTGSAVNELTVANAATGNSPAIAATGSDTDIDINLTPKGAGDVNISGATNNIQVANADPKRGIYVPAAGMFGATTNGAATGQIETSSNKINIKTLDFDASTEEYAFINLPAPSYWDLSTIIIEFHWTAASGSGDVIWGAAALARSNDDALDTALGTAVTVTDTLLAANDEHLTADSGAITVGGTPAKDDYLVIRVYRDADAGGDTLAADARLLGVTVRFGRGQYDDQ